VALNAMQQVNLLLLTRAAPINNNIAHPTPLLGIRISLI
jgi:hypothetical protein